MKLTKAVWGLLLVVFVIALNPIRANAEWKQDSNGWWNTESSSWSVGWRLIDWKWYYFGEDGYMKAGWIRYDGKSYYLNSDGSMAHDTTIDGLTVGSDGAWIQTTRNNSAQNSYVELEKLPKEYNVYDAERDGDVVQILGGIKYNIEKLDKFIENYKDKKANVGDMVRILMSGDDSGLQ